MSLLIITAETENLCFYLLVIIILFHYFGVVTDKNKDKKVMGIIELVKKQQQ